MEKEENKNELKELKKQLIGLEKELDVEEKKAKSKSEEINNNPKMKKLVEERKKLEKEQRVVENQLDKLKKKIQEQFFYSMHGWGSPNFQHKTYEWEEQTNIHDDVLFHISNQSPLYLLRNGDIEDVVKALIEKAINKCPELVELRKRYKSLREENHRLWEAERSLERELREGFYSDIYSLRKKISEIKNHIANPEKYVEQQKRLSKRELARNRLKDPEVIDLIYNKLKIKIPKVEKEEK